MSCAGSSLSPNTPLPFDPNIRRGNIRQRVTLLPFDKSLPPKDRLYIRLVVNAGSMNEDEDQRGVAHIVEHMAFNGTNASWKIQSFKPWKHWEWNLHGILMPLPILKIRFIPKFIPQWSAKISTGVWRHQWMDESLTILPQDLDAEEELCWKNGGQD